MFISPLCLQLVELFSQSSMNIYFLLKISQKTFFARKICHFSREWNSFLKSFCSNANYAHTKTTIKKKRICLRFITIQLILIFSKCISSVEWDIWTKTIPISCVQFLQACLFILNTIFCWSILRPIHLSSAICANCKKNQIKSNQNWLNMSIPCSNTNEANKRYF